MQKCAKGELRVGMHPMTIKKIVLVGADHVSCPLKFG